MADGGVYVGRRVRKTFTPHEMQHPLAWWVGEYVKYLNDLNDYCKALVRLHHRGK